MINIKSLKKFGLLGSLYMAQYLPIAFFTQALPVFLRQQRASLEVIGLLSFLALRSDVTVSLVHSTQSLGLDN